MLHSKLVNLKSPFSSTCSASVSAFGSLDLLLRTHICDSGHIYVVSFTVTESRGCSVQKACSGSVFV